MTPDQVLRWYLDAGVDETIGEIPLDRFAVSAKPRVREVAPVAAQAPAPVAGTQPEPHYYAPHNAPPSATHVVGECRTLDELRRALENFDGVALRRTALSTVFADGNPEAAVMIIGDAPGAEDDRDGRPFAGRAGKLLDRMLASIGLSRDSAYITNVVPWRAADSGKPSHEVLSACLPFVTRHIELADPQMLILLGGAAASALLARHEGISRLRGRWLDYSSLGLPRPIPALATFHPDYLLGIPSAKRDAWRDLVQVKKRLSCL